MRLASGDLLPGSTYLKHIWMEAPVVEPPTNDVE